MYRPILLLAMGVRLSSILKKLSPLKPLGQFEPSLTCVIYRVCTFVFDDYANQPKMATVTINSKQGIKHFYLAKTLLYDHKNLAIMLLKREISLNGKHAFILNSYNRTCKTNTSSFSHQMNLMLNISYIFILRNNLISIKIEFQLW